MAITKRDIEFMRLAISEARRSIHEPNRIHPQVGAAVVRDGELLASACHGDRSPCDHAEFTLLEKKLPGDTLAGCTVYTTLEPCTTRKHPKVPCATRLIERRVSRVAIGMLDPNQLITGRGVLELRRAGVAVDLFPPDLMGELEELNRDFIREHHARDFGSSTVGAAEAGLTAFYPSRDYYARFRKDAARIDKYIATAKHSAVIVSINLMTGIPFDDLCACLREKLASRGSSFRATISLLDPRNASLMTVVAPVLKMEADDLAHSVRRSLRELVQFKEQLPRGAQGRFDVRVHSSLPFGSAIMLDHKHSAGRIQIETKPYKAGLQQSFAFEICPGRESNLYSVLANAFQSLLRDGESVSLSDLVAFAGKSRNRNA